MRGSGVLACAGCSWLPVLPFLLFSRSTPLRVTDQTFLRACGGAAFLFGKKPSAGIMVLRSVPHEAVGISWDLLAGWHRTHAVWSIFILQCTVMGMCGDNFLQWSDTSSTGSGTEGWRLRASKWDVNGECNMKGSVTALFCHAHRSYFS
ncbi:hypothetical protein TcCL_ESM08515 [Trypanosoma cruzi]|nr:hypothetical protein TcCL_ESM08515 [Trypanosoma cruzi]